jgi:PAS domain S-box-containing protein
MPGHLAPDSPIRNHLDSESVIAAAVAEAGELNGVGRVSLWLTTGRSEPALALSLPAADSDGAVAPAAVQSSALSGRITWRDGISSMLSEMAVPVVAPRSGPLGVLYVAGVGMRDTVEPELRRIAGEAGHALETANLYEQAVAARDRAEAILERVADAVVVTDGRGRVIEANQAAQQLGCGPGDAARRHCSELLGLNVGERQLDCSTGCALLAEAGGDNPLGVEVWRSADEGRRQPLLASATPVRDADGFVVEVVHSLRDITRLKEADEAKTLFLATASHELKTPLAVIIGFAQLLEHMAVDIGPEGDMAIKAIGRRAAELETIVDRMLMSSRIEAGHLKLTLGPVDAADLVAERVRGMSRARERTIEAAIDPGLPAVLADASALTTVVDHLLDNAIKYSPDGGPIEVKVEADDRALTIEVADKGVGMTAEQRERCFEKFWQGDSGDRRRFPGTGIGLYIVKSLVEAMEGRIEVASREGAGTRFTVSLRRTDADPNEALPVPAPTLPGVAERSTIREFMRQIGVPDRPPQERRQR